MDLARRIRLPVRAALQERCGDEPLCVRFLFRDEATLFSRVHQRRSERFDMLCRSITCKMRECGVYGEFEPLEIGDENSPGFRRIYDWLKDHWVEIVVALMVEIVKSLIVMAGEDAVDPWRSGAVS